jgi:hypothetical protein
MNDALPAPIRAAVNEWLDRNAPISRAEFDRRNSAFIRRVGNAATHPDLGENKHLRKTSAADVGAFAADVDVALAELDKTVTHADLHGVAYDDGYVPILICLGGDIDSVNGRMHRLYHAVDDISACQNCAVTDGGTDSLTESDEVRIQQFLDDQASIDDVDVGDIVEAVPELPDDDLVRAEILAILGVEQERRNGGLDTHDYDTITTRPGQVHAIHECEPPMMDAEPFDCRDQWERLQGPQYDAVVDADAPAIWQHQAGAGKTTNAALAALERDRPVTMLFDKHQKAREVVTDDALIDADLNADLGADWDPYHLKGGEQKRHAHCMDADHAGEACPEHGVSSNCPSMCPVYDLEADSDLRQRYDAIARELGDIRAHVLLADELLGHDEDGSCPWSEQFADLESEDQVVGVHEYQTLKTATDGRDVVVDEAPSSLRTERHLTVDGCVRLANALEDFADVAPRDDPVGHTARTVATFARQVGDILTTTTRTLADLAPPTPTWSAYESYDSAAGDHVATEPPDEPWQHAEALAQLTLGINRHLVNRIKRDDWSGTPFAMDELLAAAVAAGAPNAVRQAIALPALLEGCPRCGSDLEFHNGARNCPSCGWHEDHDTLLTSDSEPARARARIHRDRAGGATLRYEALPNVSELPDDPLVLDATATPSKVAHLYGTTRNDLTVAGGEHLEASMHVTQILDGQYHASTIEDGDGVRERIQNAIDTAAQIHDRPLFVLKKGLKEHFEFPEHGEKLHYHATRGLNRDECDAVMCIGAPHPNVDDLRREAELLALGRDDVRVGGGEHSSRRESPNPPVYRKLRYEDDHGLGRAVPTKHYDGLVGDLFQETRTNELEQTVHRPRPLLADADDPVDVYLLTNVPTDVPVDDVCTFEELADPLESLLDVPRGAFDLLQAVEATMTGDGPEGFRAEQLVDVRDDGTVANKVQGYHRLARLSGLEVSQRTVYDWVTALEDHGLLVPEAYEPRAGVSYAVDFDTLQSALSILSDNGGFKVAAVRRFRRLLGRSSRPLDWVGWAQEVFGSPSRASGRGHDPPDAVN